VVLGKVIEVQKKGKPAYFIFYIYNGKRWVKRAVFPKKLD